MPPAIIRAFTSGLGNYVDPNDPLWSVMLKSFFALDQYNVDLDRLAAITEGQPLLLDQLTNESGWRFLAADSNLYGACHVGSVADATLAPKVTGFSRDAEVLTAIERFNELDTDDGVKKNAFEPRVLRVAWLRFEAYWLKFIAGDSSQVNNQSRKSNGQGDRDESNDLIFPYIGFVENPKKTYDTDGTLQIMTGVSPQNFLTALKNTKIVAAYKTNTPPKSRKPANVLPLGGVRPKV
jgi:hypothetical protein